MKKLFIIIAVLLLPCWVGAATYYIQQDGEAANKEAATGPCGTVANCMTVATHDGEGDAYAADDTIIVCQDDGANYTTELDVQSSGSNGSPITYQGSGTTYGFQVAAGQAIDVSSKDYITIDGIKVNSFVARGIYVGSSQNVIVKNCTVTGGNDSAPDHGIQVTHVNGAALEPGIEIKDNTVNTINSTGSYEAGMTGIYLSGVDGAVVSGNTVNTTYTVGIQLGRAGAASADNTDVIIENNDVSGTYGPNILNMRSDGSIIRYNKCYGSKGGGISASYDSDNVLIAWNLVYNNSEETGLSSFNGIDVNHDSQTGKIYNNTVYKVPRHSVMIDDETAACDGWEIKNNILDASQNLDSKVPSGRLRPVAIGIRGAGVTWTSDNNDMRGKTFVGDTTGTNGSFETFAGTEDDGNEDAFTDWTDAGTANTKFEAVTVADAGLSSIPLGTYAFKMSRSAADGYSTQYHTISGLATSTEYTVTFYGLSLGSSDQANFRIKAATDAQYWDGSAWQASAATYVTTLAVTDSDTSWTLKSETFTTRAGAQDYRFDLVVNAAPDGVYFDDFVVGISDTYVASDGDGDGTLYNFTDWKGTVGEDANSISVDPLFTNAGTYDLTLTYGSPAIDAGVGIAGYGTKLRTDASWPSSVTTTPVGNRNDIGAYEYSIWGSP